ncbi:MAG: phosphoglucosamine mutase, partial [Nitrospirae bacterium]|nr:phosphoglucosamine mutase [Nitrospirota bacterium]
QIMDAIKMAEDRLGSQGRLLVRPSGTEPKIRVMVEATNLDTAMDVAEGVAEVIRKTIPGA